LVHIADASALDVVDISWSSPKPAECLSIFYAWAGEGETSSTHWHTQDVEKLMKMPYQIENNQGPGG